MSREYHLGCIRDAIRIYRETEERAIQDGSYLYVAVKMLGTANATMTIIEHHLDALEAENDTEVLDNE